LFGISWEPREKCVLHEKVKTWQDKYEEELKERVEREAEEAK
jgi:hypothetical protein